MLDTLAPLAEPLETWEIEALDTECDGFCQIDHVIAIDLSTLLSGIEATNDFASEAITASPYLQDISYEPVGVDLSTHEILMRVRGYVLAEDLDR